MAAAADASDRVGIGWRPELAAGILANLQHVDVVEVIADDLFDAPTRELRAFQTLAAQTSVVVHGVSLGLASSAPVDARRLDKMARVVGALRPSFWSEHLAFVRAGGREIGHLAAPPRTAATIEGTLRNVRRAAEVVGAPPLLENIATLIDPPGSSYDETTWISSIANGVDARLLLDLNNAYANAVNFGQEPLQFIDRLPLQRTTIVHIAGGKWIFASNGQRRLLDDHLHDVPDAVYRLLSEVAARAAGPLTVILERDGSYPRFERLLAELARAREALRAGRERAVRHRVASTAAVAIEPCSSAPALEAYLARLYVDASERRAFLSAPLDAARRAGLDALACDAIQRIDQVGLELAARSIEAKRHSMPR